MRKNKFGAVIIAAGYSSRMNGFKPLLKFGNETAVEKVVNTYKQAGVDQIILVTGHRSEEISERFKHTVVDFVVNENFDQGMYTSIVKGITMLDDKIDAFFINPVDIPLVKKQTIRRMMAFFNENEKGILYPCFSGKRGHPPLLHKRYEKPIISNNQEGGLKKLLDKYADDALNLPVADESILMDMDTQADYEALISYDFQSAPNVRECYALLDMFQVPDNIRKHSEKVTEAALFLVKALIKKGICLDEAAIQAAALLHDISRIEKSHPQKGATLLTEMGYEAVGEIIATHMDIAVDENSEITENEILYLADKLVENDQLIDLKQRKNKTLEKFREKPEAIKKIAARYKNAEMIAQKIEAIIGKGLGDGKADLFSQTW